MAAAKAAFPAWRSTSLSRRAEILFRMRELVDANRKEIASLLTAEHGKVLSDAMGEVARGLENIEFACGIPHLLKGGYSEQAATGVDVYSIRQPLGVVAGITPFNFPAMVPMWMFANALACGNTFVLKPSEKDPSASLFMAELLHNSGLPDGCFNVVQGDKVAVDRLLEHPDVEADQLRRLHADRQVHLRDRDFERQARAGPRRRQEPHARAARRRSRHGRRRGHRRCVRFGRRTVHGDQRRCSPPMRSPTSWSAKIADRIPNIKVGPGNEPDNEMGPLITGEHRDKVASYLEGAPAAGATLVVDGRDGATPDQGFFLNPSLIDDVKPGMACYDDEIFGPVLSVVRVAGYEEGIDLINANPYANGIALFTARRRRGPPVPVRRPGRHGRRSTCRSRSR